MAELTVLSATQLEIPADSSGTEAASPWVERSQQSMDQLISGVHPAAAVAVTGISEALDTRLRSGQLVVATELHTPDGSRPRPLPIGRYLATELSRRGLDVVPGPVGSVSSVPTPRERAALALRGALALDNDSFAMAEALGERPLVVVRAIASEPNGDPHSGGARAMGSLLAARPNLERWAGAVRPRTVFLATPRSFCAGVERAIAIVERALERFGAPVYVRRQIVHNIHVVRDLEDKGAVFVEELDEVPSNGTVVLAAHGVSPAVREEAASRADLTVVDATCPLVTKVHKEATRFAAQDYSIVLIGHADHEEVTGTMGEAPDRIHLVENIEEVEALDLEADEKVAYLTQTTLATDETAGIVEALRRRFSHLVGPPAEDICYATQNRQDAVRALAGRCDLLLVAGSSNSSNSNRLVEVARREGCRAQLVEDEGSIHLSWLESTGTVGITAGASAPESLVVRTIEMLGLLGPIHIAEVATVQETVSFALPNQVR
jgi:4-hydroxy-3-methylbut-2-enyl diphosphate reductase